MLDTLGVFSGRGEPETTQSTVQTTPDPNAGSPNTPPPVATTPPTTTEANQTTLDPAPAEGSFISDISKAFSKNIGEPATTEPTTQTPPADPAPATEPPKEPTWRDAEPPPNVTKKVQEDWRSFKSKAQADVDARDARIKALEGEISTFKEKIPGAETQLSDLQKRLSETQGIVERVAIERSPLFKAKVLDQEDLLRSRLGKIIDGTGMTAQESQALLTGNLNTREQILESKQMSSYRRTQISDVLSKWDQIGEEREQMLSRGKETLQEYVNQQKVTEEHRRAEFMRQSVKLFEDQEALIIPKLEPYQRIDGNEAWNNNVTNLRAAARRIFDGSVDPATLAQVAILAPAAVVYQKLFQGAQKRIQDLETQVNTLRGVSPEVRDTGGDSSAGARTPPQPNGDFVKDLVSKFQKNTGLS